MNDLTGHLAAFGDAWRRERASARTVFTAEEAAFLPAALEIVERPVSPTARWTARLLLLGLALAILWLATGRIDIVASAGGKLAPVGSVKIIQSAEAGIVRAIRVRDGQRVRKGQVLVELDPTVSTADAIQADKALEAAELDAARARAVLAAIDGAPLRLIPPPGTSPEWVQTQTELARARLAEIQSMVGRFGSDVTAAMAARREADIEAAKLTETVPLIDQQIEANEALLAKGFVSKLRVIEMRRQRLAAARDRDAALAASARATALIAAASGSGAQGMAEARARILDDLARAEAETRLRREEATKARQRSGLQQLRAPVDGTVAQLAVHTVGGVVQSAQPIMTIVPARTRLEAVVRLLNKDVGFVSVGQPVSLKLEAYPFTRFGTLPGRVVQIGSDAIEDERLGLVYPVRVELDRQSLDRGDRRVAVTPGMAVTADIRTGQRSLLELLISPIEEVRASAGRER